MKFSQIADQSANPNQPMKTRPLIVYVLLDPLSPRALRADFAGVLQKRACIARAFLPGLPRRWHRRSDAISFNPALN